MEKTKQQLVTATMSMNSNMNMNMNMNLSTSTMKGPCLNRYSGKLVSSLSMRRGREQGDELRRIQDEIIQEMDIACSIDKECPLRMERYLNMDNKLKALKSFLHDLRSFNLDNKDAPRVPITFYDRRSTHLKAKTPAEIQQFRNDEAQKHHQLALQMAHIILNRYNKDQSIRCGQNVKWEFVRVVRATKTFHPLIHYVVVEASNPDAAAAASAGLPTTIRLEATYNWYIGKPHKPKLRSPPYLDHPPSLLEVHPEQEPQADKVVPCDEHNVTASTEADRDPIPEKTERRHEMGKFDDEAEVKEIIHLDKKEFEKKDVDNLTIEEAHEEVLGTDHSTLWKGDKKSRAKMRSVVQQLREDTNMLRNEIKFLKEESLRNAQEAKGTEERLENKLQLIMDKFHLIQQG